MSTEVHTIRDIDGNEADVRITYDQVIDFLMQELDEIPYRVARDDPRLFAILRGEIHAATKRAGARFGRLAILKQKDVVN